MQVDCREHGNICSRIVYMIHSKVNDEFAQNAVCFLLLWLLIQKRSFLTQGDELQIPYPHPPPPSNMVGFPAVSGVTLCSSSSPSASVSMRSWTWSESRMDQTYFSVNPHTDDDDNVNNYFSSTHHFLRGAAIAAILQCK